jgi:N-acyl-phosphatidylethanolamine-hydrolysing phospholipase D
MGQILMLIVLLLSSVSSSGELRKESPPHHTATGFRNLYQNPDTGWWGFLKWRWRRLWQGVPNAESCKFPLAENDPRFLRSNRTKTTLTWIGHATVLLQLRGRNILTDPQFSERASPFRWIGPRRVVEPGLDLQELPSIDAVVISHDHYDSLDTMTIKRLVRRDGGDKTVFFVPLGLGSWFRELDAKRVIELDWWESQMQNDLRFIAVPAHHWSKRGLLTRNQTLWAGWVIEAPNFRFYFAGDSGYQPIFKEIGRRHGPFDLAAIPIGAYEPRWFMKYHHLSPEEAVKVHVDVKSKKSVAIHWGTFKLSDEPLDDPPKKLRVAIEEEGIPPHEILALKHGETIMLSSD